MREREDENRTREAGNRDEVEGVVANTLKLYCNGAVGFIDWLGVWVVILSQFPPFLQPYDKLAAYEKEGKQANRNSR